MWTAKLKNKTFSQGQITLVVEYTSGSDSFTETYVGVSDARVKAKQRVSELNNLSIAFNAVSLGNIDLTVAPVPQPTQGDVDLADYADKLSRLEEMKKELGLGLIAQKEYDDFLAIVKVAKDKV